MTVAVAAALALSVFAETASAGIDDIMNSGQGLSAGNAKSSSSAHSGVYIIFGSSNHTFCPAVAVGYSGYTSSPFSGGNSTAFQNSLCGPGYREWRPNPSAQYVRGAVYNPNASTFDTFNYASYQW